MSTYFLAANATQGEGVLLEHDIQSHLLARSSLKAIVLLVVELAQTVIGTAGQQQTAQDTQTASQALQFIQQTSAVALKKVNKRMNALLSPLTN